MKLVSWNVNGLRAVHKKGFLDWLHKAQPDVLCLQETKCQLDQVPEEVTKLEHYQVEYNCAERKGYSGVATFTRPKPVRFEKGFGIAKFDAEGRVLKTTFPDFVLYNIYFPNGKMRQERLDYKMEFYDSFLKILAKGRAKGENDVVICGDVNTAHKDIDLARPKENRKVSGFLPMECAWIDKLLAAGFLDSFREFEKGPGHYSYWDQFSFARERNVGWRIDYFFISESLRPRLKDAFIWPQVLGSDHCPVGIELAPAA